MAEPGSSAHQIAQMTIAPTPTATRRLIAVIGSQRRSDMMRALYWDRRNFSLCWLPSAERTAFYCKGQSRSLRQNADPLDTGSPRMPGRMWAPARHEGLTGRSGHRVSTASSTPIGRGMRARIKRQSPHRRRSPPASSIPEHRLAGLETASTASKRTPRLGLFWYLFGLYEVSSFGQDVEVESHGNLDSEVR
jgi:hypothetical protein